MARGIAAAAAAVALCAAGRAAAAEPRSWEDALAKAQEVMPRINYKDRRAFLHGIKVAEEHHKFGDPDPKIPSHKGYTRRIKELGVPGLKMQDGASGFHNLDDAVGSSTCFPSMLALASTWDPKLAQAYGTAIGTEFKGKGANVLLGPMLNVHRAASDGRNVMSLSGEDPYLGASLAREYIGGVHGQGVIAAPKNFAFSEPKTFFGGPANVLVAESAAWQLYYPPFEAAVEAGAVAMTCPSNQVNGVPACGNKQLLVDDLRGKMGFKGLVLSDWGATVSGLALGGVKMVQNGLDLEMPTEALLSKTSLFFSDNKGDGTTQAAFDAGVVHVLAAIYRMGLDSSEGCGGPHICFADLHSNQTNHKHWILSRSVATDAVTLLKNDGVLPLEPASIKKIAIIGRAADMIQDVSPSGANAADYYSAGGPDHCRAGAVVTPLSGISRRAAKLGIAVASSTSGKIDEAVAAAQGADVVVVVAAATSTAAELRPSLHLDGDADALIEAVAKVQKTVVLMQTPGAVLTPWRNNAAAVANLFLAGPETGTAWAAILFGDAEPSGRLPVMFPATEDDVVKPRKSVEEGEDASEIRYTEGLFTSYRARNLKAAFPFGHGLSYTSFGYGAPSIPKRCHEKFCVSLRVNNTGSRPGREVAQAYLEFPAQASVPPRLLRGFKKTKLLAPGESEELSFAFTERDVSTYHGGAWTPWKDVVAHFGASSGDLRHELVLQPPPPPPPVEEKAPAEKEVKAEAPAPPISETPARRLAREKAAHKPKKEGKLRKARVKKHE